MKLLRVSIAVAVLAISAVEVSAESLPQFRPGLIGNQKKSLINLINAQGLMERGQKDGTVSSKPALAS